MVRSSRSRRFLFADEQRYAPRRFDVRRQRVVDMRRQQGVQRAREEDTRVRADRVMPCLALLTVVPTDRALVGWQPFGRQIAWLCESATPLEVVFYVDDVGAGLCTSTWMS